MKQQQRYILPYAPALDIVKDVLSKAATLEEAYLITEEELKTIVSELVLLGWEYKECGGPCIHAVLNSPFGETIEILRAGRTLEEVVDEIWTWLMKRRNKSMRLEIYTPDEIFKEKFLKLFHIVERDESDSVFIVKLKRIRKKQLADAVEIFIWHNYYYHVEYCYSNSDYFKGWGLEGDEKNLCLWKETSCEEWLGEDDSIHLQVVEELNEESNA